MSPKGSRPLRACSKASISFPITSTSPLTFDQIVEILARRARINDRGVPALAEVVVHCCPRCLHPAAIGVIVCGDDDAFHFRGNMEAEVAFAERHPGRDSCALLIPEPAFDPLGDRERLGR